MYSRNTPHALQGLRVEFIDSRRSLVARILQRSFGGDHVVRVEARVEPVEPDQCTEHQPGADQKDQAERHLGSHQGAAHPLAAPARDTAATFIEHTANIQAAGVEGRRQAEQQAGQHGDSQHHTEHPPSSSMGFHNWLFSAPSCFSQSSTKPPSADTHDTAAESQQHALHQQLAYDDAAAPAQRHPRGDLAAARARPRASSNPAMFTHPISNTIRTAAQVSRSSVPNVLCRAGLERDDALLEVLHFAREGRIGVQRLAERSQLTARLRPDSRPA